jgi:hypothetical protein
MTEMNESKLGSTVALVEWARNDEIAASIIFELERAGYRVIRRCPDDDLPKGADFVFTYAPYGRWCHIAEKLVQQPASERSFLIHWNTEGLPNPHVPLILQKFLAIARSRQDHWIMRRIAARPSPIIVLLNKLFSQRLLRFRYLGDYLYLAQENIPSLLVDISELHRKRLNRLGVQAVQVPFGSSELWSADCEQVRDIDVLWLGARATLRRNFYLNRIQKQLADENINFKLVDGQASPFIFGSERNELISRSKIVLNLARTSHDDNTLRMFLAMPNKALVISEPLLDHGSGLTAGEHYVEARSADIPDVIRYYLSHEEERLAIVERAYAKTTCELTMQKRVTAIMEQAERQKAG